MFVGALDNPLIFLVTIFDCFPCFRGVYIVGNMAKMRTSKRFLATTVARKQNTSVSKETSGMKWIKDFPKIRLQHVLGSPSQYICMTTTFSYTKERITLKGFSYEFCKLYVTPVHARSTTGKMIKPKPTTTVQEQ